MLEIRQETKKDYEEVYNVVKIAFKTLIKIWTFFTFLKLTANGIVISIKTEPKITPLYSLISKTPT